MTKEYIDEFLGRSVKVINAPDPTKIGIEGFIFNETKNMFFIKTKDEIKKVPKKGHIFDIYFDKWIKIDGNKIEARPEERIKLMKKLRG